MKKNHTPWTFPHNKRLYTMNKLPLLLPLLLLFLLPHLPQPTQSHTLHTPHNHSHNNNNSPHSSSHSRNNNNYIEPTQQTFRRTPDNQTATIGDRVTLACSVINKVGVLQWTRDGFGLGTERNLVGYERYRMSGSEEEGDYTLVIDSVTLEDDAIFQCQVGPGPPESGIRELRSADAKLTVDVPTGPPVIIQGETLATSEDREISLECASRAGKPAAELTWLLDGSTLPTSDLKSSIQLIKEPLEDGKRFNSRSILKFRPQKQHHNRSWTCQAHNRPSKEVLVSPPLVLSVKYAPKVTVKALQSKIFEGDTIRFTCTADGNPSEMTFRWFVNDQVVVAGDLGRNLVIGNVTRKLNNARVKCEAVNSVGRGVGVEGLVVYYGPSFRSTPPLPSTVEADLGSSVSLTCDVEGNPSPEIVWFHEPTRNAVATTPNHTVTLTEDTQGKYVCQAVVQGFPQISAVTTVLLRGPPRILSPRVQYGVEGDTVRLECLVRSVPRPERVWWSTSGGGGGGSGSREIEPDDPAYSILEDPVPFGLRSILVIRSSQEKHFGTFNCSVVNAYGSHVQEIYLFRQKSSQLMWILTFVIGGVVLIVAVTMVTLLCQRSGDRRGELGEQINSKPDLTSTHLNHLNHLHHHNHTSPGNNHTHNSSSSPTKNNNKKNKNKNKKKNNSSNSSSGSSSNDSDLKVEIRTASSLSNIPEGGDSSGCGGWDVEDEEDVDEVINNKINGSGVLFSQRFSDYIDGGGLGNKMERTSPTTSSTTITNNHYQHYSHPHNQHHQQNGYVPYSDYNNPLHHYIQRYSPQGQLHQQQQQPPPPPGYHMHVQQTQTPTTNQFVDPRYSATYGNPYLQRTPNGTTTTSLPPPPPSSGSGSSLNKGGGSLVFGAGGNLSNGYCTHLQYIVPPVGVGGVGGGVSGVGGVVVSNGTLKPGTLATHV